MPPERKAVVMQSRKSVSIYENWKVYSMHGKLMFRCNEKKAQWYLARQLGKYVDNEERAIQLTFVTKGEGHAEGDYMIEDRVNACVGCGQTDGLTLHHVVPEMYRRWMPLIIKSKSSRDLLVLCKQCHCRYEQHATALKKKIADEYNAPLEGRGWVSVPEHRRTRKAASALLKCPDKIPKERQAELRAIVCSFLEKAKQGKSAIPGDDKQNWIDIDWDAALTRCAALKDAYPGADFAEHGQIVVQALMAISVTTPEMRWPALETFIKQWRQHFIDHLQPKFLSERWTVDGEIYTHADS